MQQQWLMFEHSRLHVVEAWPDSPYRDAALAAVRSAIARILEDLGPGAQLPSCSACRARKPRLVATPASPEVNALRAAA